LVWLEVVADSYTETPNSTFQHIRCLTTCVVALEDAIDRNEASLRRACCRVDMGLNEGWRRHPVTVMRRSRSRVGGPVLLPRFIEHLLPELHHRYVM
jgi:hypothetical protein